MIQSPQNWHKDTQKPFLTLRTLSLQSKRNSEKHTENTPILANSFCLPVFSLCLLFFSMSFLQPSNPLPISSHLFHHQPPPLTGRPPPFFGPPGRSQQGRGLRQGLALHGHRHIAGGEPTGLDLGRSSGRLGGPEDDFRLDEAWFTPPGVVKN